MIDPTHDFGKNTLQSLELTFGKPAPTELVGIEANDTAMASDSPLHCRLRHGRVVATEMTMTPVTYVIDHNVCSELHSIFGRQLRHGHGRIGIVGVDVNDRRVDCARDVRAKQGRSRVPRMRYGRADLIVQDQMQGSADAVPARLGKVERLGDHALRGERGIAMN